MLIDLSADCHIHTALCHHASGTMEEYVSTALASGLKSICFLEHMEVGINTQRLTWLEEEDFDNYFTEGARLQKKYAGRIEIGLGVEVGFNPESADEILTKLSARSWDIIGLSCHFHKDEQSGRHLNLVSRRDKKVLNMSLSHARETVESYYQNLLAAVEIIPCDMICHLDAVLRFHPRVKEIATPWDLIDKLLDQIKSSNIALEINTSGLAIRGEVFPSHKILARAREKGIIFKAGSDSHSPKDVGHGFGSIDQLLSR